MSFHSSALAQSPSCADTQKKPSNETQHNTEVSAEALVQQADKLIETLERNNCEKPSVSKQSDAASHTTTNHAQPDKQKAAGALDMANKHWQLRNELTGDSTIQIPYFCEGTYTDYSTRQLRNAIDYEKLPIYTASDKTVMSRDSVSLFGNISITQDGYHLEAHRAKIDRESRQAELSGSVIVQSPTGAFSGDNASISLSQRSALLTNAEYILFDRQTRGSAEAISVNPEQGIRIDGGSYTLCPPNNDWWQLEADTIYLDHRKQIGSTKHARLKIKGVPVAYIPYRQLPIGYARNTGLLFPT
ncbi:LPS-assembly protein LptD, partial [bacterium]|nr:LPS-assembly protein LptD [bacterium]